MRIYILQSAHFGLFEIWETGEAAKASIIARNPTDIAVRPYGEGWNIYLFGKLLTIGTIRPHTVLRED